MDGSAKIEGLEAAMKAMAAAFPKNAAKARSLLNQTMSASGRKSILPAAKSLALVGDGSGALSESLNLRAASKGRAMAAGAVAKVQVTPVRYNPKAIAMYTAYYGGGSVTSVAEGIRHGHLVEFGHIARDGSHVPAYPFMWPALQQGKRAYVKQFAAILEKKIAAAVKRAAKKAKVK